MRRKVAEQGFALALIVVALALLVFLFTSDHGWVLTSSQHVAVWLAVSCAVIIVADSRPVTIVNGRKVEPIGMTISIAMAMTVVLPNGEFVDVSAGYIALLAGLAAAVASLPRMVFLGHLPVLSDIAMRVVVTAIVALAVRTHWGGEFSLEAALVAWEPRNHWALVLAMTGVAGVALSFQMLWWSYERSAQERTLLRYALGDEFKAVATIGLGVISTAVSTALAARVVGAFAMVLFVVPLVVLLVAVRRQTNVVDGQRQTVWALSKLTDQGGFTDPGHAARVARLAVPVGRQVGLAEPSLKDLEYAALLHDLGQLSLQRPIPGGATAHISALDQRRIATAGAALLSRTTELTRVATVLAHQATAYRRLEELGDIPMESRIVRVVNAYDDFVGASLDSATRMRALQRLRLGMGYDYDPKVLRELCRVLVRDGQISREDMLSLELWPSRTHAHAANK